MPRTKSAKKQMRQARTATARNKAQRSALRTALKKVRSGGVAKDVASAYADAKKMLDRAGRKGLIHRNTAARQKSRLAKLVK
jgi:small subunit ribosomal protein S20